MFRLTIGLWFLSLILFFGCGDDDGPVGPEVATGIIAFNGRYYKGNMGYPVPDTILRFAVADEDGDYLVNQQIQLHPLAGDGELSDRSIITDSSGTAGFWYAFTGDSGHAAIRLVAEGIDSLDILLRANTLIPGPHGQGQYVLFDDTYADVKKFNGDPASVDIYQDSPIIYVDYEESLGVVVMVYDLDTNGVIYDTSSVYGVIVNTNDYTTYTGTTAEGIGVGSSISDIRAVYREPDTIRYDSAPPDSPGDSAVYIRDLDRGLTFYSDFTADTSVLEIHLIEWVPTPETGADSNTNRALSKPQSNARRIRGPDWVSSFLTKQARSQRIFLTQTAAGED
jgi:hypothetical protein